MTPYFTSTNGVA